MLKIRCFCIQHLWPRIIEQVISYWVIASNYPISWIDHILHWPSTRMNSLPKIVAWEIIKSRDRAVHTRGTHRLLQGSFDVSIKQIWSYFTKLAEATSWIIHIDCLPKLEVTLFPKVTIYFAGKFYR